ncbi:MAG: hypothetical protein M1358_22205, partial [Chloroflexi bacterium]|nr:hypothetical protein [Chloroflexota bacterium]
MSEAFEHLSMRPQERVEDVLLRLTTTARPWFFITVGISILVLIASVVAFYQRVAAGPSPGFIAIYLATLVFFVGISQSGPALIALLRLTGGDWRRPLVRPAYATAVFAPVAVVMLYGLGQLMPWPSERSLFRNLGPPLVWVSLVIVVYYVGALLLLYVDMIPDLALQACRAGRSRRFYELLSIGWQGSDGQWRILLRTTYILGFVMLILYVTTQSILAVEFSQALVPAWDSPVFLPFTVVGLFNAGTGALVIAIALLRRVPGFPDYLGRDLFHNLGNLLLATVVAWFYFWVANFMVFWYGNVKTDVAVLQAQTIDFAAPVFWLAMAGSFFIPFFAFLISPIRKSIGGVLVVSVSV